MAQPYPADVARQRLDLLAAMSSVMDRRQEFLAVVAAAADAGAARQMVMSQFGFDEVQASAVLDLQVRRFCEDERSRITDERVSLQRSLRRDSTDL